MKREKKREQSLPHKKGSNSKERRRTERQKMENKTTEKVKGMMKMAQMLRDQSPDFSIEGSRIKRKIAC